MPALTQPKPSRAQRSEAENAHTVRPQGHEADFLYRLQTGDNRAWERLVAEWAPRLYNYLAYHLQDPQDVEALLSDVMLTLVKEMAAFPGQQSLAAWIYTITYRKVRTDRRYSSLTGKFSKWSKMAMADQSNSRFYQTIARLSEPAQHAIWLRYREGLRVDEIAHVLNCANAAVENMLRQFAPDAGPRPN